jgi:arylsulfatase A-like enzyme
MAGKARCWWTAPVVGLHIGALAGILEVLLQLGRAGSALHRMHLFEAAVLYGLCGSLLGLALLAAWRIVRRPAPSLAASIAVAVAAFAFLLGAGFINVYYLPEAMARSSLIYTGAIFLGALIFGLVIHALVRRITARRVAADDCPKSQWRWIAMGIGIVVLAIVSYFPRPEGPGGPTGDATGKPNVLIILIDALRYDHLSLHGYERETSPRIDAFGRGGIRFSQAYAQSPWTKPSTASILTGLYPSTHGVSLLASGVPESAPLLAEHMRRGGYRTALLTANSFITPMFGFGRGVDYFYASSPPRFVQLMLGHLLHRLTEWSAAAKRLLRLLESIERALVGGGAPEGGLRADGLVNAFLDWQAEEAGPFFAYLHLMEPHMPYGPPPPDDARFMAPGPAALGRVSEFPAYHGFLPFEPGPEVSADSLANMLALYDGEIFHADRWLGTLFDELDRRGLTDETLIVLTADHGEEFYDRGGWGHGHSLYNELLRIPLMISAPEATGLGELAGELVSQPVRHIDVVPTILEICDLPLPAELDGASLLPVIADAAGALPARPVFSEVDHGGHFAYTLQQGAQKAIFSKRGGESSLMLFDLAADPGERHDLAPEQPGRAAQAREELEAFRAAVLVGARNAVDVTIDEATREQLRGLGYIR